MPGALEEVCLRLGHLCGCALDLDVVHFQRLVGYVGDPGTHGTDVILQRTQVTSDLVLIRTHLVQTDRHLLEGTGMLALTAVHGGHVIDYLVEVHALEDHGLDGVGHYAGETVVTVTVRGNAGQLHDLQIGAVDVGQRLGYAAYDVAHITEGYLQTESVITGLQVELESTVLTAVIEGGYLPVGVVIETEVVTFLKGNLAVDGQSAGYVQAAQLRLLETEVDGVQACGLYVEVVLNPLTGGLPLLAADGVTHDLRCMLGLGDGRGSVVDRVDRVVRNVRRLLTVQMDHIGTFGVALLGIFLQLVCVGGQILIRIQTDSGDDDVLADAFQGNGVLALLEIELEGIGVICTCIRNRILGPLLHNLGYRAQFTAGSIQLETSGLLVIVVLPGLRQIQIAGLLEGHLIVNIEHTLDGVCLGRHRAVFNLHSVKTCHRDRNGPSYLAGIAHIQAIFSCITVRIGNTAAQLHICRGCISDVSRNVDCNVHTANRIRIFLPIRCVGNCIQGFTDIFQRCRAQAAGTGLIRRECGNETADQHQKRQHESHQSSRGVSSHRTFLLLVLDSAIGKYPDSPNHQLRVMLHRNARFTLHYFMHVQRGSAVLRYFGWGIRGFYPTNSA